VAKIGDDLHIRRSEAGDEGTAQGSRGARDQNSLFYPHFAVLLVYPAHFRLMTIWFNGQLENHSISPSSAGVTLGWGVFTTIGVRQGSPLFLERHLERLQRDAGEADIPFAMDLTMIRQGVEDVLRADQIKQGLLRLTLTQRGDERWSQSEGADLSIMALETSHSPAPLRVQMSPYRVEAKRPLAGVKTTSYLPYLWAWREAKSQGFDEAILRNGGDFLSEAARSSLFWVKKGEFFTPSLGTGCLRGLGRDLLVEWLEGKGKTIRSGEFSALEVLDADETHLISAATGPRPIGSWHDENGVLLRRWDESGPLWSELRTWWEQAT
jgi:branched-chain amino acid aminotransferase